MNNFWKRGNLVMIEGRLLAKAGINTSEKKLTHFYPPAVESHLEELEKQFAGRDPRMITRTLFKIRAVAGSPNTYEFYVDQQEVLPPPTGSQTNWRRWHYYRTPPAIAVHAALNRSPRFAKAPACPTT